MTKTLISTFATFALSGAAFAHSGHTEVVDGHSHTLAELAIMGATPVALGLAVLALVVLLRNRKS